jgi:hypothetical protein
MAYSGDVTAVRVKAQYTANPTFERHEHDLRWSQSSGMAHHPSPSRIGIRGGIAEFLFQKTFG